MAGDRRTIAPNDAALLWAGAIEVEHASDGSRAWRLPFSRIDVFPGERLRGRAAMPAGVRIAFTSDTGTVGGRLSPSVNLHELSPIDLLSDGVIAGSATVKRHRFEFGPLPPGTKQLEIWLPQFGNFRLASLWVDEGAVVSPPAASGRRRLITYGSSITQCRTAVSPTRTWPALVARELGLDLTCLGFGGECHLDPMIARMIRDLPAEVIVACLGINVHGLGTFNDRSLLPALLGFLSTVRDGHPGAPVLVISPIVSPGREATPGPAGLTLAQIRDQVGVAVRLLRDDGDGDVHLLDGLDVLGPGHADRLPDGLHPDPAGYEMMAGTITPAVRRLLA